MDKAEELAKQIALIRDFSWELTTTETQNAIIRTIEQYVTEVSRERAINFLEWYGWNWQPHLNKSDEEIFDIWFKEQGEQDNTPQNPEFYGQEWEVSD